MAKKCYLLLLVLVLQSISCHCQSSFNIRRYEDGDEVASTLTSVDYCSSIRGYLDGSQCKCNYRFTFSLDHQRCIDYYNGKDQCQVSQLLVSYQHSHAVMNRILSEEFCRRRAYKITSVCICMIYRDDNVFLFCVFTVPTFRFSRAGLADVSVSVVNIAVDTTGGAEQYALQFTVSPDTALPIAQGTGNTPLPTGCSISSIEFNTPSGWAANSFSGFTLVERDSASYLEVVS